MQRAFLLAVTVFLCFFLGACDAKDTDNLFETTQGQTPSVVNPSGSEEKMTGPSAEGSAPTVGDQAAMEEGYSYGNMQKNVPSGDFMQYEDDIVFLSYSNRRFRLCTYDMKTGEVSLFFKDATNQGGASVSGNLESYDGKLYVLNPASQAMEVKSDTLDPIIDGGLYSFWHSQGDLYVKTKDSSLLVYENGGGEPRTVLEEFTGIWSVVFGQYLYANVEENIVRVDLEANEPQEEVLVKNAGGVIDGNHIYYVDYESWHLYRCDMDGSNPVLIVEKPVLLASMNFENDYFYFRLYTSMELDEGEDCYDIYRFPKADPTQIEKIATLSAPAYQIYTVPGYDKIFVKTRGPVNESGSGEEGPIYVMGLDGSDARALELPDF